MILGLKPIGKLITLDNYLSVRPKVLHDPWIQTHDGVCTEGLTLFLCYPYGVSGMLGPLDFLLSTK